MFDLTSVPMNHLKTIYINRSIIMYKIHGNKIPRIHLFCLFVVYQISSPLIVSFLYTLIPNCCFSPNPLCNNFPLSNATYNLCTPFSDLSSKRPKPTNNDHNQTNEARYNLLVDALTHLHHTY